MQKVAPSNSLPASDNVRTYTIHSNTETTPTRTPSQSGDGHAHDAAESPESSNGTRDSPLTASRRKEILDEMIVAVCPSARGIQGSKVCADATTACAVEPTSKMQAKKRKLSPCTSSRAIKVPTPLPRVSSHPLQYSTHVMILHPDYTDVVGYGKVGASWKTKVGKLGKLYQPGEQMVQINTIVVPGVPLLHTEERHFAKTLDGALTPIPIPSGQKVFYVKWNTRYLVKE